MRRLFIFFETNLGKTILSLLLFIFLFVIECNFVGLSIRDKTVLGDTLDFSWFSDAIERLLHGYILGKDFTFTYGPLFQFIYALPSLLFHTPSYVSVVIAPILSFIIIFVLMFYIAKNISEKIYEQMTYLLFVFIVLGLLVTSGTDTIKALVPMVYSLLLFNTLQRKFSWPQIIIVSSLPTIAGLYAYNLFFTTCLITLLFLIFFTVRNYRSESVYKFLLLIPFISVIQVLSSFLLTHNLDYIRYSVDSIANYRYLLDVPWTHDRDNMLIIFPLVLILLGIILSKTIYISAKKKEILFVLVFASLIELDYAVSRSDAAHLLWAFFPSILTFFSIVFVLAPKVKALISLAFILYLLVPFKPTVYNTLAPKNILAVFRIAHQKPDFFSLYTFPDMYYYSQKELQTLNQFIRAHKNSVYIYPYDSYLLNTQNTTYDSFALGLYTYSNSIVETNTVTELSKNPPKFIILGIDTKGALNLDDIPNFTRNPQLALWMIKNYSVTKQTQKYLILSYAPHKKTSNNTCQIIRLTITPSKKDTFIQRAEQVVKPAIYYLGTTRLPYSPKFSSYLLFQDIFTSSGVKNLFESNAKWYIKLPTTYANGLTITRVDPFFGKKQNKIFSKNEYKVQCVSSYKYKQV